MSLTKILRPNVIAQIGIFKSAPKNLAQVNRTDNYTVINTADEEAQAIGSTTPLEEGIKLVWLSGW